MRDDATERDFRAIVDAFAEHGEAFDQQREGREKAVGAGAFVGEFARHLFPAVALIAEQRARRQEHVLEHDFVEMMFVREIDNRADLDARRLHVDDELADAAVAVVALGVGAAEQDHIVRDMRARGPHLRAVDLETALDRGRARACGGEVAP